MNRNKLYESIMKDVSKIINKHLNEMARPKLNKTIDPKIWASVSSICSRNKSTEAEFIKPNSNATKDMLLPRYVAALLIMKKPCPTSVNDINDIKTFKLVGQRYIQNGGTIEDIQKLYNENKSGNINTEINYENNTPRFYVYAFLFEERYNSITSKRSPKTVITEVSPVEGVKPGWDLNDVTKYVKETILDKQSLSYNSYVKAYILDIKTRKSKEISLQYYPQYSNGKITYNEYDRDGSRISDVFDNILPKEIENHNVEKDTWYIDYYPTWDRDKNGRYKHDDLQHGWVYADNKAEAISNARNEIDDLGEIIRVYKK